MKITVIGAGNMGAAFVKQLSRAGHQVSVTARDAAKTTQVAAANPGAIAVPTAGAAEGADAVVLATGYGEAVTALRSVGNLAGKVVIDITNPLTADYMSLTLGHNTSAAEEIAKAVPGTEVVKAFTPCSHRCSAKVPTSATAAAWKCSSPATASAPGRPPARSPRALASRRSTPGR